MTLSVTLMLLNKYNGVFIQKCKNQIFIFIVIIYFIALLCDYIHIHFILPIIQYKQIECEFCGKKIPIYVWCLACNDCCINKYCVTHTICSCKDNFVDVHCVDFKCLSCCQNTECSVHYRPCHCVRRKQTMTKKYTPTYCTDCKYCCSDFDCHRHFVIQDYSRNTIIECKKEISEICRKLPTEIIDYIIDDFVDTRITCNICQLRSLHYNMCICNNCGVKICRRSCTHILPSFPFTHLQIYCSNCFVSI